ncbi:MAG: exosortase-associated EpsI family protein [Planctomycetota bacterium]
MAARPNNRALHRIAAPIASAVVLAGVVGVGTLRPSPPEGVDAYIQTIVTAIDDTPYRINGWTGRDLTQPPTEAVDMLRPSRVLHRGYVSDGGRDEARMVIVHCPDVRDMAGHHPPNCYPATGWTTTGGGTLEIEAFGREQTFALHRFDRREAGTSHRITVVSGFIVPGHDRVIPEMSELRSVSENRRRTKLGAAQLQIIMDTAAGQEEIREVVKTFLPALEPVVDRVTEGAG